MEYQEHIGRRGPKNVLRIPAEHVEVIPGVRWDRSAADRPRLTRRRSRSRTAPDGRSRSSGRGVTSRTKSHSVSQGYGMPAEIGWAGYERLAAMGLIPEGVGPDELVAALREPREIDGRWSRYRFMNAKSRHLAAALESLRSIDQSVADRPLRDALVTLPGSGPKTASWVRRNLRASDEVAIIDIHVVRACRRLGVFPLQADPAKHYRELEDRFLAFSEGLGVRASFLDLLLWEYARAHPILTAAYARNTPERKRRATSRTSG